MDCKVGLERKDSTGIQRAKEYRTKTQSCILWVFMDGSQKSCCYILFSYIWDLLFFFLGSYSCPIVYLGSVDFYLVECISKVLTEWFSYFCNSFWKIDLPDFFMNNMKVQGRTQCTSWSRIFCDMSEIALFKIKCLLTMKWALAV